MQYPRQPYAYGMEDDHVMLDIRTTCKIDYQESARLNARSKTVMKAMID